jgi:hypothetical protein
MPGFSSQVPSVPVLACHFEIVSCISKILLIQKNTHEAKFGI